MLRERSLLLQRLLFGLDVVLIGVAWVVAWFIRFDLLPAAEHPPLARYLGFLPAVLVIWSLVFLLSGLYQTRRAQRLTLVIYSVSRAIFLGLIASLAATFFYRQFFFSRLHMVIFGVLSSMFLVGLRSLIYIFLRRARQQGRNIRRVLIVGAGKAGARLAQAFAHYPWMGFNVVGFLDDRPNIDLTSLFQGKVDHGHGPPPVLGSVDSIGDILTDFEENGRKIDLIYAALPLSASGKIEDIANAATAHTAHMCLVPDIFQLDLLLNSRVSDVDGLPVIHLLDEAPFDIRQVVKRVVDVAFSLLALLLLSPLLLAIAIAVKLSSPGPVFYRQERMGLNGQTFTILKFRSMPVNAESKTGAVWAQEGENRATRIGAFLRKTSLDELPQFINVLKGDMSVVGPRPERPVLIEGFRHEIPGYMLRHKMKAGITGWAQVNGWRGNTSLEKRIQYDLYYIQNWSLWLDVKIMILTVIRGFVHKNAY